MSYILDALKKSEQERNLGEAPKLNSEHILLHQNASKNFSIPLVLSGLLILLTLGLFGFYVFKQQQSTQMELAKTKAAMESIQRTSSVSGLTPKASEKQLQEEANRTQEETILGKESVEEQSQSFEIIRPSKERKQALQKEINAQEKTNSELKKSYQEYFDHKDGKVEQSDNNEGSVNTLPESDQTLDEVIPQEPENAENWRDIATIYDLSETIRNRIPSLEVSTHIYSSAASYRRVTINGKNAKEGAEIEAGIILEQITEDGVVFSFEGNRFRMNAIDEWAP